jgi:CBS domain-containing protein
LPVLKDGRLVGIITVRDIVYRAISKMNLERPASDYMNPNTIVIWDGTPLQAALEIMVLSRSRALPVIDEKGNLVGIVDDSDIVKVSDVETESKMSHMAGRTEGDSWTWDSEDRVYITKRKLKVPDKLVRDIMEKNLITITRKTSVSRCAELMKQHRIEQTPVVGADGRLVGVVHDADLLRALI